MQGRLFWKVDSSTISNIFNWLQFSRRNRKVWFEWLTCILSTSLFLLKMFEYDQTSYDSSGDWIHDLATFQKSHFGQFAIFADQWYVGALIWTDLSFENFTRSSRSKRNRSWLPKIAISTQLWSNSNQHIVTVMKITIIAELMILAICLGWSTLQSLEEGGKNLGRFEKLHFVDANSSTDQNFVLVFAFCNCETVSTTIL